MSNEIQVLSNEEVVRRATKHWGSQASWIAIDELTRRALESEQLWGATLAAVRADRAIKPRYIPYGSHVAIARILDSGNERLIRRLLHEMDTWNAYEQKDAIRPWAGNKRVAEATRQLQARYGWSPKYMQASEV